MIGKSFAVLAVGLVASQASATGLAKKVFDCKGGSGEDAASVKVTHVTTSAPGGPVSEHYEAAATASWFGGTHHSGTVTVTKVVASDGGPTTYANAAADFGIEVYKVETAHNGKVVRIDVKGDFKDKKTGMAASIRRRWLSCK